MLHFLKIIFCTQGRFSGSRRETTFSSLPARRTLKTVMKCKFLRLTCRTLKTVVMCAFWELSSDLFIIVVICIFFDSPATLSSLRAQNVGTLMILLGRGWLRTSLTCFIHFWARRCSKTCISKFWNARRCRKKRISFCRPSPLAGFSGGDHLKL